MRQNPAHRNVFNPLFILASLATLSQAGTIPNGYWKPREAKDYEEYVHIKGNKGFLCVLDDKSSFRFKIIGDSITTPWDGKNAIAWIPASGDLVISGEEKGETYSTRYQATDASDYPAACRDAERRYSAFSKPRHGRFPAPRIAPRPGRDALGRKAVRNSGEKTENR